MNKRNAILALACCLAAHDAASARLQMDPIWSIQPGTGYISTASNQRGMAYNPKTGHVLVIDKLLVTIYIFDGATGAFIGTMDTSASLAVGTSNFKISLIRVADDGAVYAGNLSNSTSNPQYALYRWESESSPQTVIYGGLNPSPGFGNQRWGDTMAIRGSGTNTMILSGTRGAIAGIFRPTDATMATFAPAILMLDAPVGASGYGVAFGAGNSVWLTPGATSQVDPPPGNPLRHLAFDLNITASPTVTNTTLLQTFPTPPLPSGLAPIMIDPASNLLAGVVIQPGGTTHTVNLYDISTLSSAPVLYDFQPTLNNANSIFDGALDFAHADSLYSSNRLFVLDCNNGVYAYALNPATEAAPSVISNPIDTAAAVGSTARLNAGVAGSTPMKYQWYLGGDTPVPNATNSTLALSNVQFSAAGTYNVRITNSVGDAASASAILTVSGTPPPINVHVYEPFNYNTFDFLPGQSPGPDLSWIGDGGFINEDSLIHSGLAASIGRSLQEGGNSTRLTLGTNVVNRDSIYYSFLMRVDALGGFSSSGFVAAFFNSAANVQECQLTVRHDAGGEGYNLGITKITATPNWATNILHEGQTILVVCRYQFNTGGNLDDAVDLWIDPPAASFGAPAAPPSSVSGTLLYTDITLIDQFVYRQTLGTPEAITFDELRVDTSWSAVTPPGPDIRPQLEFSKMDDLVTLSWPRSFDGYVLQSSDDLSDSASWTDVPDPVILNTTTNTVMLSGANSGAKFFRLRK